MSFDCEEYFYDNIERAKKSAGGNHTGVCPSCGKFGGFYAQLDPDHEKYGNFVCYKCEFRGKNFIWLIATVDDLSYEDASKVYRKREDIVFVRRKETPATLRARIERIRRPEEELSADIWDDADKKTHADLPAEFKPVYDAKRGVWRVPEYMTERGFKREAMRDWNIGYCERGKYEGRIIIPLVCPNGESFTARDLTGDGFPKYLNPESVDHSLLLFGWNNVVLGADFAIVEGPLDALKMYQHGIPAVAFGGKSLSNAQLELLFLHPESTSITVMLDPDAQKEAYGIANKLKIKFENIFVAKIPPMDNHGVKLDPGSSTKKQAWKWYEEAKRHSGGRMKQSLASIFESMEKSRKRYG